MALDRLVGGMRLLRLALLLAVFAGLALSGPRPAAAAPLRVAVVPYINSSGETRNVVDATVSSKLEGYFHSGYYEQVPPGEVADFLWRSGYGLPLRLLPEKELLQSLAAATGADAVLAFDFTRIQAWRRSSWFYAYTIGGVSMYVKALSVADNNFITLRIEREEKLRASRFGPGVSERVALGAAIEAGMDEMFSRLPF
ncbi:MAG: hypothetical protein E6X17_11155 [Sporomusaceae bacterium]|nr:hypothetical protein [Sporomusaceae bacterium]